ncbi:MAG: SpoIID/LytB domain-containing protein [Planctomycetota bacterium]
MKRLTVLSLMALLSACFGWGEPERLGGDILRVALAGPESVVEVRSDGPFQILDGSRPSSTRHLRAERFRLVSGRIVTDRGESSMGPFVLKTLNPSHVFIVGERTYHGLLKVVKKADQLFLILEIPLEDYVAGVVACESGKSFVSEALKVQAVISRTYAVHKRQGEPRDPGLFDVWADTRDQVFKGEQFIAASHRRAVRDTAGVYLEYRRRPLPCYFHSTCGGHTQDAVKAAFLKEPMTPLGGVECSWCRHSPHWRWKTSMALSEVSLEFTAETGGGITHVSVRDGSDGSPLAVLLMGERQATIPAYLFRRRMGPARIKSSTFSVQCSGHNLTVEGSGWGHGVGLCQWGSDGMAKAGHRYKDILMHYFPGCRLTTTR